MSNRSQHALVPSVFAQDNPGLSDGLETQDISMRQAIRVVRKRKRTILITTIICSVLVLVLSIVLRTYYSSMATIEIQREQSDPLADALSSVASTISGGDDVKTDIQTQVGILQSDDLGIETMERTHFEEHWMKYWHLFGSQRKPEEIGKPLREAPRRREALLKEFEDRLTINPIPNTRLIQLSFEDPDSKYAAQVTNALIDQYVKDLLGRRNSSTVQASDWMEQQISELNKQVQKAQENLIQYERQSGIIAVPSFDPTQPGAAPVIHNPVVDRLIQMNTDLVNAQAERISREAIWRLAKAGDIDALVNMAASSQTSGPGGNQADAGLFNGILAMRQQQVALKLQLATALQTMGAKNPHLIDLDRQLGELDQQMKEEVKRIVNRTELDYQIAKKAEDGLRADYNQKEAEANQSNDAQIRLAVLQQEADSTRRLYEDLYTKLQESKLQEGTQSSNVAIISTGLPPAKAAHPKPVLYTAAAVVLGFMLGVVLAFIFDNLDDAVVTSVEIEGLTRLPVLGNIPSFDVARRQAEKRKLPIPENGHGLVSSFVLTEPNSMVSEAYRALRTTILLSQAGAPPRTMMVTSSLPAEGKTTTVYNLAACFAQMGTRVLVIDADLRKPSLNRYIPNYDGLGLSNLLTSNANPADLIRRSADNNNLFILAAGPVPPNPAELLSSQVFSDLLSRFSKDFDLVIVDSPPSMLVTDAAIISVKMDAVLVVARSGSTTRPALMRTIERLQRQGINPRGLILNAVNTHSAEYYYTNGYYGGNNSYYSAKA